MKTLATAAAVALLAALGVAPVSAAKLKPLGYFYSSCSKPGTCTFEGNTNAQQSLIYVSEPKVCSLGQEAFSTAGGAKIKNGHFSLHKTVTVTSLITYAKAQVTVQVSGTFRRNQSAKGTLTFTTTAEECSADSGKKQAFSLKYRGPYYGG